MVLHSVYAVETLSGRKQAPNPTNDLQRGTLETLYCSRKKKLFAFFFRDS